jgi:hypothetical protein
VISATISDSFERGDSFSAWICGLDGWDFLCQLRPYFSLTIDELVHYLVFRGGANRFVHIRRSATGGTRDKHAKR